MKNKLLTRRQVATICGVEIGTVKRWQKEGKIIVDSTVNGRPRYSLSGLKQLITKKINPTHANI